MPGETVSFTRQRREQSGSQSEHACWQQAAAFALEATRPRHVDRTEHEPGLYAKHELVISIVMITLVIIHPKLKKGCHQTRSSRALALRVVDGGEFP